MINKPENIVDEILKTEYSEEFDKRRKDLICVSFYKYGPVRKTLLQET